MTRGGQRDGDRDVRRRGPCRRARAAPPSACRPGAASRPRGAAPSGARRRGSRRGRTHRSSPMPLPRPARPRRPRRRRDAAAQAASCGSLRSRQRRASRPARRRERRAAANASRASMVSASVNLRTACRRSAISSRLGPTPVPPEVLAATALPMIHHRSADFHETFTRVLERHAARCTAPRTTCSSSPRPGTAAMESRGRQRLLAGRPCPRRLARLLRRAVGDDRRGLRARRRPPPLRVGRAPEPG